ncbi:hemolysin XhlA family protein [Liquorilactobacillus mali]|uniref:Holin n=1 Tax=Liquorilactobacillus mali TaxID=1618 RepID=A0A0R2FT50_9LACO|nr:hemolysin XhlA family protein [Liquorilactobacillus mali]KRN31641.1 hypothetical protein IV36_GL001765 [Liquorilactobacillus mali]MDN7145142.1 hemolysin XhlA family protein [Liquorilactobacillus mali]
MENEKVVDLLMDIQQRLAKVETNTQGVSETTKKAEQAYQLSQQNEQDIQRLKSNSQWWSRTMWVAIILPIVLFLVEQFIIK